MGSADNRLRRKWQDYGGHKATNAEYSIYEVFKEVFKDTDYVLARNSHDSSHFYSSFPVRLSELLIYI